jgi:hypothetical protein
VTLDADTKAVLLAAGAMFLIALGLGVWKYRQMATTENHLAHSYAYHGWRRDTDNQFRDPVPSAAAVHGYMTALIVGEIGAFSVLLAGFVDGQIL